ncbi:hypothetical protein LLE59_21190 [Xanthomonas campestris]|nr:hypothetical protein [Xanthomonas campestris]MCC5049819.1 hypothetical protein [Xanthomonas campestris]MCC5058129.1 hypothetical protein [Xanthomonas campestris]MCC5062170.1 hypothetical protein [Xanthomonas campestris]
MDLSEVTESDFSLLPYADLPLGALKRTKGGLANELAISVNFGITRDPKRETWSGAITRPTWPSL